MAQVWHCVEHYYHRYCTNRTYSTKTDNNKNVQRQESIRHVVIQLYSSFWEKLQQYKDAASTMG